MVSIELFVEKFFKGAAVFRMIQIFRVTQISVTQTCHYYRFAQ